MTTLFDEIAGGRREHVAKGALAFLLRNSQATRAFLAEHLKINSTVERIDTEYPDRWRADVAITWRDASVPISLLELKLGAPFTALQRNALDAMVVVAPKATKYARHARTIDLEDLVAAAEGDTDPSVRAARLLLRQACEAYGWYREAITWDTILRELKSIFVDIKGSGRGWDELYRFMSQVDGHLRAGFKVAGRRYDSDEQMRPSHGGRYYGFYFGAARTERGRVPRPWWIGFEYPDDGDPSLRLYDPDDRSRHDFLVGRPQGLLAADVAAKIVEDLLADQNPPRRQR